MGGPPEPLPQVPFRDIAVGTGGTCALDLDGRPLPPPGAEEGRRFATALYRGEATRLREVKALPEAPRRLGLVREPRLA